jgi:plasmid stabilization system protein ParE
MADVLILPRAARDYQEAMARYQSRSVQAAAGFEAAVEVALRQIAEAPGHWAPCDQQHRFYSLRRYPFSIIYRIETNVVMAVAIAPSRRSDSFGNKRDCGGHQR